MENKKLYRSRYDNIFAGVCSGLANYFGFEPIILQVLFFALLWSPIPIFWIYILFWVFLKKEPTPYDK